MTEQMYKRTKQVIAIPMCNPEQYGFIQSGWY